MMSLVDKLFFAFVAAVVSMFAFKIVIEMRCDVACQPLDWFESFMLNPNGCACGDVSTERKLVCIGEHDCWSEVSK